MTETKKIKILLTGSNGLLGQSLCRNLMNSLDRFDFVATSKSKNICSYLDNAHFKALDVTDYLAVHRLVESYHPDIIIHTAAMSQVDYCELHPEASRKVNVEGARNMALACKSFKAHFIHLSTDFVFDGSAGPYDEQAVPAPQSQYGKDKLESELIVQSLLPEACILRTALVFGWHPVLTRSNFLLWVKNSLEKGREINVVCDQFRTPTFVEELAAACLAASEMKVSGIFHISGKEFFSVYEFAQFIAGVFELPQELIHPVESSTINEMARRPYITGFETGKAERILHFLHIPLQDALMDLRATIPQTEEWFSIVKSA
ncbi:MAG: dTDP-4-dehydrorhamnose reductase [Saprospiraceae bacterium]|jgi:dTDP-4-dehydrorhamnose reductase|nr:dTDP-4-dehydrorhamnose reductase [Saprospiraceae bacterium]